MIYNRANIVAALLLSLFGAIPVQAASPVGEPAPDVNRVSAVPKPGTKDAGPTTPATSVLERFRTYSGPRTPAAMSALFSGPVAADVRQQPEVAVSDGATTVRISITVSPSASKAPNIAFNGAQLISLKRSKADQWDIEALPDVGTQNASLTLLTDSGAREILLTIAPTVPQEIDLSELGFVAFLRGAGSSPQALYDLNDDGRRDYVDDYIFTANYLARPHLAEPGSEAAQSSDPSPQSSDETLQQQTASGQGTGDLSQPSDTGQAGTSQGAPRSTGDQASEPQGSSSNQAGSKFGQTSIPQAPSNTQQGTTAGQTAYQRNLAIRRQLLRDQRERMNQPVVTPTP